MMRGGCSVKSSENHYSVMNRIMLRFRPIAPKPAGGQDVPAAVDQESRNGAVKYGRRNKRKYVTVRGRQGSKRKASNGGRWSPPEKSGVEDASSPEKGAVTLQLLPDRSESDKSSCCNSSALKFEETKQQNVDNQVNYHKAYADGGLTAASMIKTWIVVECVTETYIDSGVGLGFSDGEKIKNLQADACPGFVSDATNNVVWVNEAYRKMVVEGEAAAAAETELMVWLVVKEKLPYFAPQFACRVRMIQQTKYGHKRNRMVPCDVWRMEFAGFAWKLDVKTALGLGI